MEKLVVLGMFDLTHLGSARAVRIDNIHAALQTLTPTVLLSGTRRCRRAAIIRFLIGGGLRDTRALYVEASTSTATEMDLLLLVLARAADIPLLVYIPDAYQYFPDLYVRRGVKVKLLDTGWRISIAAYRRLAHVLLFPSPGLAACFKSSQRAELLPPAGVAGRTYTPPPMEPPAILYLGGASLRYGSDLLLSAMEQVVVQHPSARCHFVTVQTNADVLAQHPARHAPWLVVEQRTFRELPALMRSATVGVIPLRVNAYNNLAIPVKLFDYMSFGRPLVVTRCRDTAALVTELESGLVTDDTVQDLAQGILRLLENLDLAARLGRNGYNAIQASHAWSHRAARLLTLIEAVEVQMKV